MSLLSAVKSSKSDKPRRLGIYGASGVGKTTFAAQFPSPIIVDIEGGCGDLDVPATPRCTRFDSVCGILMELSSPSTDHPYETVVIDSMDWAESLIMKDMHNRNFNTDYGRGAVEQARLFSQLLGLLDACRDRGMNVVMLAHQSMRNITDANGNQWTRVEPKLSKKANDLFMEYCDELGLARQKVFFSEAKTSFGSQKVARTVGEVELVFAPNPQHASKKRLPGLPASVNFWDFAEYSRYVPYLVARQS